MEGKAKYTRKIRIVKVGDRFTAEKRCFLFFWRPALYKDGVISYFSKLTDCERVIDFIYKKEVVKVLN